MNDGKTFGFFPEAIDLRFGPISISTLDDFDNSLKQIQSHPDCSNGWIYAASQKSYDFLQQRETECPYPARVFGLPHTHSIRHEKAAPNEYLDFLIWAIAFFVGCRLTSTEAGFLDATPVQRGRMLDFYIPTNQLGKFIELAENFWHQNKDTKRQTKRVCAAIHTLFLAGNPRLLPFESFTFAYITLDTCFKMMSEGECNVPNKHRERVNWMCEKINLAPVSWDLYKVRNDTFHEGLYFTEPLGFSTGPPGNISLTMKMRNLACRLLMSIFGCQDQTYLTSNPEDRQQHLLII